MRVTTLLLAVGLGCLGRAQAPPSLGPTAQLLERTLRIISSHMLIVVDGPDGEWKAKLEALNADPEFVDLDLNITYFGSKSAEVSQLLQQAYHAGPRPQWVLFGPGGRVVASAGSAPTPGVLSKAIIDGGFRSLYQILKEFTRQNPEHLEGRQALCEILKRKAAKRTALVTGGVVPSLRQWQDPVDSGRIQREAESRENPRTKRNDKPPVQLDADSDQRIWGELADLIGLSFRSGDWIEMQAGALIPDDAAIHSPIMQDLSRLAVPEVERALARNPTSWNLWTIWLGLTKTFGGKPIRPLLDSLLPLPMNATNWPPFAVRIAYVKEARKRNDWTGIRDLLLPQVETARMIQATQNRTTQPAPKRDASDQEANATGDYWRDWLEPLIEALLWLGDAGQADELVRWGYSEYPWPGLPKSAQALAVKCGHPHLAAKWASINTGR